MIQKFLFTLLLLFSFAAVHTAQSQQIIHTSAELSGVVSSSGTTPFWIQSNRSGAYSTEGSQIMSRFQVHGSDDLFGPVRLHYGADLIARPGAQSTIHFNQGYLKLRAYGLELAAGRFMHISHDYNEQLGMGALGVSGNSTPVPQVRAGLYDWTPLPLSFGLIEIKAHLAHGWLGSNRFTEDVLYHEKVGLGRIGGSFPFNIYGGIHHFAKWGGKNHPVHGDLPQTFTDFWRVFFARGGDEETAPQGEADYMLGDHLGAWDFGFYLELNDVDLKVYRQFPLETKDNLKFKSLQDALTGFHFKFSDRFPLPVTEFVYEYMYTKWQDGPRRENIVDGVPCSELPPGTCRDMYMGDENYYNHGIYRTGWTYNGYTIGNPLFIPAAPLDQGVLNNRIVAHHIGMATRHGRVNLTTRATYSRNYGTRRTPFDPRRDQWSFAAGIEAPVMISNIPAILLVETAYDNGDLVGNQFGVLVGLRVAR